MQLVIDIGNTKIKAALFEKNQLIDSYIFESKESLLKSSLIEKYRIKQVILTSVTNDTEEILSQLQKETKVFLFTNQSVIPIKNLYQSPNTLGSDRLAAAVGANSLFPNQNILIVDAGTCIKYNFVTSSNEFIGGAISPGLQMRFKALHTFTARLPLVSIDESFDTLIGVNSTQSILSGVELGALAEVEGLINQYNQHFNNLKVFLTGGDFDFFVKRLKIPIFADQNLIMKGLNVILEFNSKAVSP